MKRYTFFTALCFLFLFIPNAVSAQTHPCEQPPQVNPTKGNKVGWCHDRKDADNLVYGIGQLGFKIHINSEVIDLGVTLNPIGNISAVTGEWYFEVSIPTQYSRGIYALGISAYSAEGSSTVSAPLISWQIGGPPSVPKNPRVK